MNSRTSAPRKNSEPSTQGFAGTDAGQGFGTSFEDPIIREVRDIRHRLAERFGNDLGKVAQDLIARQTSHGSRLLERPSA
jgi:hypothetical protein